MTRIVAFLSIIFVTSGSACDLCAIYNKDVVAGKSLSRFSFGIAEQFVPARTVQLNDMRLPASVLDDLYLDTSTTHLVPTWNISDRFGISANIPYIYKRFNRLQLTGTGVISESGHESGFGDMSAIGRATILSVRENKTSFTLNLLGGVKFPTGDAGRVEDEVRMTRELDAIYGVGHQHAVSGVHPRDLALGSGSVDGIMGITASGRADRFLMNMQLQYYLRTSGESGYRYGDELIFSGGPGFVVVSKEAFSLSVQCLAVYDYMSNDHLFGRENLNSGMTAIYLGPQVNIVAGRWITANVGVDVPVQIRNNGLQNVPDYRLHFGLNFAF